MPKMKDVPQSKDFFISYSVVDQTWAAWIAWQLETIGYSVILKEWDFRPGGNFMFDLNAAIRDTERTIVVLSPDYVTSVYSTVEWATQFNDDIQGWYGRLLPVRVRACELNGLLAQVTYIDLVGCDETVACARLLSGAKRERAKPLTPPAFPFSESPIFPGSPIPPSNPYRGLLAFREEDAPYFFGRDTFIEQLLEMTQRHELSIIVGSSGSGKSSIVFAGLFPHLCQTNNWQMLHFRPGIRPFYALASVLIPVLEPAMSEIDRLVEIKKLAERLSHGDLALQDVLERLQLKSSSSSFLLVADQFEELYTFCEDASVRSQFLDSLLKAGHPVLQGEQQVPGVKILLTLRADFLDQALSHPAFTNTLQNAALLLGSMNVEQLKEVIEKPAQKANLRVAPGLLERIISDIGHEPGALPLLEFALALLWEKQEEGQLTHNAYEAIGGIKGALTGYAEQVYDTLNSDEKDRARYIFMQLVRPGEGTADTRRVATRQELGEENWAMVRQFSHTRLVVTNRTEDDQESVELAHEALIQNWERLEAWMGEDRDFRVWQERFRLALRQWMENERDEGTLLRGALLNEAIEWFEVRNQAFSEREKMYLGHSILYNGDRRNIHDWYVFHGTVNTIQTFLKEYRYILSEKHLSMIIDYIQYLPVENLDNKLYKFLRNLIFESNTEVIFEKLTMIICQRGLLQRFIRLSTSSRLYEWEEEKLLQILTIARNLPGMGDYVEENSLYPGTLFLRSIGKLFSDYGRLSLVIFTISYLCGQVTLLIASTIFSGFQPTNWSFGDMATLSFEACSIAIVCATGIFLFVRRSLCGERTLSFKECLITSIPFLPISILETVLTTSINVDYFLGRLILFCVSIIIIMLKAAFISLILWTLFRKRRTIWILIIITFLYSGLVAIFQQIILPELNSLSAAVVDLSYVDTFSNAFHIISNEIYAIQLTGQVSSFTQFYWFLCIFTVFGCLIGFYFCRFLAPWFVSNDITFLLEAWSFQRENVIKDDRYDQFCHLVNERVLDNCARASSIALRYACPVLIICVALFLTNEDFILSSQPGHHPHIYNHSDTDTVSSVAWSPDGTKIASEGKDNTVFIWDAGTGKTLLTYRGHSDIINSVAWSPDGTKIASGGNDKKVLIWDATTGKTLFTYRGHSDIINSIAWSPDGTRIASISNDSVLHIWYVTSQKIYASSNFMGRSVNDLSWSPDGRFLGLTVSDGTNTVFIVWNILSKSIFTIYDHFHTSVGGWSPDSTRVALVTSQSSLQVRNIYTDKILLTITKGINNDIDEVVWSPDGTRIALCMVGNMTIQVWNIVSKDVYNYTGHSAVVHSIAWSPDSTRLVSVDENNTVQIWNAV